MPYAEVMGAKADKQSPDSGPKLPLAKWGRTRGLAKLSRSWPAAADSVPDARRTLAAFAQAAGANQEQTDRVRLAVSEAVTNAVIHAYKADDRSSRSGQVHTTAAVAGDGNELWILISDDGFGLRPDQESPGLGHGLRLISEVTDDLTVTHRGEGGTLLQMRFDLGRDESRTLETGRRAIPARA